MSGLSFPQLQTLLVVAESGSFSAAARELGVSRSAVSQSIQRLEEEVGVPLVARTTRSVSLTPLGRQLVDAIAPAFQQTKEALEELGAEPGETKGTLRLSVPRSAHDLCLEPIVAALRAEHPRIEVELVFEDRRVDLVRDGYDAGVRLSEYLEKDMVGLRLSPAFRFVVVASPSYLDTHGVPERPEDLEQHECLTFRSETNGALYAWELERGKRTWRVPVRGHLVASDGIYCVQWAERGLGLAYAMEPMVREAVEAGRLKVVLDRYAAKVPGFFLYYPSRARSSPALRCFIEVARRVSRG